MDEPVLVPHHHTVRLTVWFVAASILFLLFGVVGAMYFGIHITELKQKPDCLSETPLDFPITNTGIPSKDQVEQIKDSATPVASEDTDTLPLEEVVAPIVTPDGKTFFLTFKGTKVTMDYPDSVRILKIGYLDKDSMNYGRKDFDLTNEVTYFIEREIKGHTFKAEIQLGEVKQSYGNKDSKMIYELYSNQFYLPEGTTAFTPNSTFSTKDGHEVYDFSWGDANSTVLEYVILDRRFEPYSTDNITRHNVSTAVTLRVAVSFDEYEDDYQLIEQTKSDVEQLLTAVLKSLYFERVPNS